jgi:hypothetical protein
MKNLYVAKFKGIVKLQGRGEGGGGVKGINRTVKTSHSITDAF